jgi:hypothetical protein
MKTADMPRGIGTRMRLEQACADGSGEPAADKDKDFPGIISDE